MAHYTIEQIVQQHRPDDDDDECVNDEIRAVRIFTKETKKCVAHLSLFLMLNGNEGSTATLLGFDAR